MNAASATELWRRLGQLLVPGACLACHAALDGDVRDFCGPCSSTFSHDLHATCPRCSSTVGPHVDLTNGCTNCRAERFAFEGAIRLGPYEGRLREMILRMKLPGSETLVEASGEAWSRIDGERVRQEMQPDLVVPVPMHWRRRWRRGFNQSELLAERWAKWLTIPCRPRALRRSKHTPPQSTLAMSERRDNVRGAFRARGSLAGARVLLIDDVLTTGSTAHEAARTLKSAGASRVFVAVLAHGR